MGELFLGLADIKTIRMPDNRIRLNNRVIRCVLKN
jgi:hypothetical protein